MAFPDGWNPGSGIRAPSGEGPRLRFFKKAVTVALGDFSDNAYPFIEGMESYNPTPVTVPGSIAPVAGGNAQLGSPPHGGGITNPATPRQFLPAGQPQTTFPAAWCRQIRIVNLGGGDLEISFNGTTVHGYIPVGSLPVYYHDRTGEGGISVRGFGGAAVSFIIEAW